MTGAGASKGAALASHLGVEEMKWILEKNEYNGCSVLRGDRQTLNWALNGLCEPCHHALIHNPVWRTLPRACHASGFIHKITDENIYESLEAWTFCKTCSKIVEADEPINNDEPDF